MRSEAVLWREASVAADVEVFLDHVGAGLLDDLGLDALAIRALDTEGHLDTVAWIRRGRVGVSRPARPRTELREASAARLRVWIAGGEAEVADASGASAIARDLLR